METNLMPKNADFYCINCDFRCFKKSNWENHVKTKKHIYRLNGKCLELLETEKNAEFYCYCGLIFKTKSGLWKHKNKCQCIKKMPENIETSYAKENDNLIIMLIKQNGELIKEQNSIRQMMMEQQNMVLEIAKNGTNNNNTTYTNSHNKSFNLQFFLNETCKDAMNITDFVESIKLQLCDLEKVGEIGYIEGISNIITKNLNALDVTKRPIHCTDKKRETMYIKDEDKWEKEDEEKKKLRKVIKKVADKNARLILKFREKFPEYNKSTSKISDKYNKIIIESMGGSGDNDIEKEDKIIRNITKATTIDKN